jgi:hypothetical protein
LKNIAKYAFFVLVSIFLSACGDESSYDNSPVAQSTTKELDLSGVLVDGYIQDATVCLDSNKNDLCDADEASDTTDSNGKFDFANQTLSSNSLINILAYGGTDTSTQKIFNEKFKTILDVSELDENSTLIVSPITDLVSHSFSSLNGEDALDLSDAKTNVADLFDITTTQVDEDPMKNIDLFAISQEIQHTKLLIETLCLKSLGTLSDAQKLELVNNIKKEILQQNLNAERIIIALEVKLSLSFNDNAKTFVKAQAEELKNTLNALSKDTSLSLENLNRLQKSLDLKQQEAYDMLLASDENTTLEVLDLNITTESITQTPFDTTNATYDEQACKTTNGYISLSNAYIAQSLSEDSTNEISIKSNYAAGETLDLSEVKVYYPELEGSATGSVALVFGENYYFVYDEAWTQNSNKTIYIQTPNDDGLQTCYRYELNTISTSDIYPTKVFSYIEL